MSEVSEEEIVKKLESLDRKIKILNKKRIEINNELQKYKGEYDKLESKLNFMKSKEASSVNWAENKYEWSDTIQEILTNVFKLQKFRQPQLAAINAFLSGKDVFLLMPTGGGKSLCYQLPALVTKGITIVVSPLLALIDDQILALQKLGIGAGALNSSNSKTEEGKKVWEALGKGANGIKLIFITPEYLAKSKRFMNNLQKCHEKGSLDRFAIDEVHCCSNWGHDFRKDFQFLHILKQLFPTIPILGLTATATDAVLADSQKMLGLEGCVIVKDSYNRPNLFYEVKPKPSSDKECVALLVDLITVRFARKSGLIYCCTVNDTFDLASKLKNEGISVGCYNANIDFELRHKVHMKWLNNEYQVIVATVAFGMGIDKPDVRFVIHHSVPKSMSCYYQESGRAGRDGKRADCIVLYNYRDVFRNNGMVYSVPTGIENSFDFAKYCLDAATCRRALIASYFDNVWNSDDCNKMCDHCVKSRTNKPADITNYCKDIYKVIEDAYRSDTKLTPTKLLDAWSKTKKMPDRGIAEYILMYLILNNYLQADLQFTLYSAISYINLVPGFELKPGAKIIMYDTCSRERKVVYDNKDEELSNKKVANSRSDPKDSSSKKKNETEKSSSKTKISEKIATDSDRTKSKNTNNSKELTEETGEPLNDSKGKKVKSTSDISEKSDSSSSTKKKSSKEVEKSSSDKIASKNDKNKNKTSKTSAKRNLKEEIDKSSNYSERKKGKSAYDTSDKKECSFSSEEQIVEKFSREKVTNEKEMRNSNAKRKLDEESENFLNDSNVIIEISSSDNSDNDKSENSSSKKRKKFKPKRIPRIEESD